MLAKLQTVYLRAYPGETSFQKVYTDIFRENPEPDLFARNCFSRNPVNMVDVLLVSAIYSARAAREYKNNQRQLAWTYLMDAQYHAGAAWYAMALTIAMPEIEEEAALSAIKDMQREGGKVKNAPWLNIENYTVELIRDRAKQGETWTSERKMAIAVRKEVMQFAKDNGPPISKERFVQTISDRLKRRHSDIGQFLLRKKDMP